MAAARKDAFPRINLFVDLCNYISLKYLLPISIWDLDRTESDTFHVRLGHADENYVFNNAGQTIGLEDLIVCCEVRANNVEQSFDAPIEIPIVNPVKDGMRTKTNDETTRIAALLYAPAESSGSLRFAPDLDAAGLLARALTEFTDLITESGPRAQASHHIINAS